MTAPPEAADATGASPDPDLILHAALPADWDDALGTGEYRVSTRGVTLEQEGFIHCSRRHQVEAVVGRFYADVPELVLLTIDPARLGVPVVDEPPADGIDELFPHVYGPIPVHAVTSAEPWRPEGGRYRLPTSSSDGTT